MDIHLSSIDHIREQIIDLLIQFGPRLLTAILIIIAGVIVGGWADRWLSRALRRFDLEPPASRVARAGHPRTRADIVSGRGAAEPRRSAAAADRRAGRGGGRHRTCHARRA